MRDYTKFNCPQRINFTVLLRRTTDDPHGPKVERMQFHPILETGFHNIVDYSSSLFFFFFFFVFLQFSKSLYVCAAGTDAISELSNFDTTDLVTRNGRSFHNPDESQLVKLKVIVIDKEEIPPFQRL